MGLNTVAVLFNDCCFQMEQDEDLGKRMAYAVQNFSRRSAEDHFRVGCVISSAHADYHQVVIVHGNTGSTARDAEDVSILALEEMADCLRRHGWIAKAPSKRKSA